MADKARLAKRKRRGCLRETARRLRIERMRIRGARYATKAFIKQCEESGKQELALYVELLCETHGYGRAVSEYAIETYLLKGKYPDPVRLDLDLDDICHWIDKRTRVTKVTAKRQGKRKSAEKKRWAATGAEYQQGMDEIKERGRKQGAAIVTAMEALKNIKL